MATSFTPRNYEPMKEFGGWVRVDLEEPEPHVIWRCADLLRRFDEWRDPSNHSRSALQPTQLAVNMVKGDLPGKGPFALDSKQFAQLGADVRQSVLQSMTAASFTVMVSIGATVNTYTLQLVVNEEHGTFVRSNAAQFYEVYEGRNGRILREWSCDYALAQLVLFLSPQAVKLAERERRAVIAREKELEAAKKRLESETWFGVTGQAAIPADPVSAGRALASDLDAILAGEQPAAGEGDD